MLFVLLRPRCCVVVFGLLCGLMTCRLPAATLYVATDGNDTWSGKLPRPNTQGTDGPLATLAGARDAVRRLKVQRPLTEAIHVQVATGIYPLTETLTFEPQDSGTGEAPITYEAVLGARPVLTGGRKIEGFVPVEKGQWKVHLPEVAMGKWYFEDLYINGRRAIRARSPNEFYYYVRSEAKEAVNPDTGKSELMPHRSFVADQKDIAPLLAMPKEQLSDVVIVAPYHWECSVARVASVDANTGTIVLTGNVFLPNNEWKRNHRYHIEGIKAALDAPGEWFLDRKAGDLYYIPRPGEDMNKAEVIAPVVAGLVRFAGDPASGRYVEHIAIKGLAFRHDRYPLPPEGHCDVQAAVSTPAAIMGDGMRYIELEDVEVAHVGAYAVWFRRGCQHCRIERCLIQDMAAGGVRIGQGWRNDHNYSWNSTIIPPGEPRGPNPLIPHDATGHCVVDNNIIRSGGHLFRSAVGVWVGHSAYNQITHNDIGDFRYSGVSVGWSWAGRPSVAHHNRIELNHIHHIGWGVLTDMGGIYLMGRCPGTTASNNVIHDVYAYDYGGWGLYNDEGSVDSVLENNLVYNTKSGGYHQNATGENLVRNNIFAFGRFTQLSRTAGGLNLCNNIIYWDHGSLTNGNWDDPKVTMERNLYFDATGAPVTFLSIDTSGGTVKSRNLDWAAWQSLGKDRGSIVADPKFVNPAKYDFHLQPDSPAAKVGFKPFDYTKAGVYGTEAWHKEAASINYPPMPLPPSRP